MLADSFWFPPYGTHRAERHSLLYPSPEPYRSPEKYFDFFGQG